MLLINSFFIRFVLKIMYYLLLSIRIRWDLFIGVKLLLSFDGAKPVKSLEILIHQNEKKKTYCIIIPLILTNISHTRNVGKPKTDFASPQTLCNSENFNEKLYLQYSFSDWAGSYGLSQSHIWEITSLLKTKPRRVWEK